MYTAYLKGSLKLSKTGEWWHNGQPFQNVRVSELFTRCVVWDEQAGDYFIHIGAQRAAFDREDTAFFVTVLDDSTIPWTVHVSDESSEALAPEKLSIGSENQIYYPVHDKHPARLTRAAHQTLLRYVGDDSAVIIAGRTYKLSKAVRGIQS